MTVAGSARPGSVRPEPAFPRSISSCSPCPPTRSKALGESDGLRYLEVVFVKPGEVIEHQPKPSGNGTFSVSFDEPA